MNIFEKLSIPTLVSIVGENEIESINSILNLIGDPSKNSSQVISRTFLAEYVRLVYGFEFISNKEKFNLLLSELPNNLFNDICDQLGVENNPIRSITHSNLIKKFSNKQSKEIISSFFGLPLYENSIEDEKIDNYEILKAAIPYKALKDYQFEVLFKSLSLLEHQYSRFILQMPTGSGKTRTAIEIIVNFINDNKDCSVIWLAHSSELCDQAASCFLEVWPHVGKKNLLFKRHYGKYNISETAPDKKVDFLCCGFQSVYSELNRANRFDNYLHDKRLIVDDEAHKATATTYQFAIQSLMKEGSNVMGLTATPGRSYKSLNSDAENQKLSEFFFEEIVTFSPAEKTAIQFLRDKKILADASLEILDIEGTVNFSDVELMKISDSLDLPKEFLVRLGKNQVRTAEIIQKIIELVKERNFKSIIFFATSLEQSKLVASLLNFLGVKAAHVDGDSLSEYRENSIAQFRNQKIEVLCNYEVLSTGFDAPLVDCVFIARPTSSVVLYSQMIGRGLRGPAIGGKEECLIVNVRDNFSNLPSIDEMYRIFDVYWN